MPVSRSLPSDSARDVEKGGPAAIPALFFNLQRFGASGGPTAKKRRRKAKKIKEVHRNLRELLSENDLPGCRRHEFEGGP